MKWIRKPLMSLPVIQFCDSGIPFLDYHSCLSVSLTMRVTQVSDLTFLLFSSVFTFVLYHLIIPMGSVFTSLRINLRSVYVALIFLLGSSLTSLTTCKMSLLGHIYHRQFILNMPKKCNGNPSFFLIFLFLLGSLLSYYPISPLDSLSTMPHILVILMGSHPTSLIWVQQC